MRASVVVTAVATLIGDGTLTVSGGCCSYGPSDARSPSDLTLATVLIGALALLRRRRKT